MQKKAAMTLEQTVVWALIIITGLIIVGLVGYFIFNIAIGKGLPAIFG